MTAAVSAPASAAELVDAAEEALVLSDFAAAEQSARQCLARAAYLAPDAATELQDRACVVALQALAETQRFGAAHRLLRNTFGQQLEDAPPHSLLVWLALALDTDKRGEAQRLIQSLLDSRHPDQPGEGCCWSRRQYLTLLHLYCFEVLLKELREPAAVQRWVEETQLPISEEDRQLLWAELAQAAEEEAARRQQSQLPRWEQQPALHGVDERAAAEALVGMGSTRQQASTVAARQQQQAQRQRSGQQQQAQQQQRRQQSLLAGEPQPGAAQHKLGGGPAAQQEAPPDPAAALRTLGSTVLGAVLIYAVYAERAAVRSGLQRARRGVSAGLAELAGMALSMRVNPVAAAAPALR
ncbi:hypothetical protein C2E20_0914 [Micractinium conductrix]|uniref:Uncharacterized protein n=1 Tax=Micractinium conductrix TaxID=554055 RepID=A0A2P6VRA5_9CHLO|nr:hypothetical protein C2E20_0914 [Micractinium conductrix]|eukprot:PSC76636.1 hypothetical protein C2E20_0914 [Micractinium conductrix]